MTVLAWGALLAVAALAVLDSRVGPLAPGAAAGAALLLHALSASRASLRLPAIVAAAATGVFLLPQVSLAGLAWAASLFLYVEFSTSGARLARWGEAIVARYRRALVGPLAMAFALALAAVLFHRALAFLLPPALGESLELASSFGIAAGAILVLGVALIAARWRERLLAA
ncbi:MAG TPA: hypothetical protein VM681_03175 [Candidatus Thermoplasmatota archaeon]|nr:hypothetical protein [Candidatus Thermoplasmatota archaeon]